MTTDPIATVREAQAELRSDAHALRAADDFPAAQQLSDLATALDAVVAELERQAQEIAALRADAERLDFLDRNLEKRLGWEVGFAPAGTVCVTRIFPPNNEPTPIRAAIDAARAKEAGNGN